MFSIRAGLLLTMLVLLVSTHATAQNTSQSGSTVTIDLVAKNIAFNVNSITVPPGSNVVINFDNQDNGVHHNFAVYTDSSAASAIFKGDVITGPKATTYTFKAPATPGAYFFRCDIHPAIMNGQFLVSSGGAVSSPAATPASVNTANQNNGTRPSSPYASGFDGIFAITGLLAAAYLVFGKKR